MTTAHSPESIYEDHSGHDDGGAAQRKSIWRTFVILSVITAFEFLIAFVMPISAMKIVTFVAMTLVKAAYIIGEFMHLKYEVKGLLYSILIPIIFVVWLCIALLIEGDAILSAVFG